jgi:hypothetical protein
MHPQCGMKVMFCGQDELSTLKEGEVKERTPARPPQRSFGPARLGQALFGQRPSPSGPPRSYGKATPGSPQVRTTLAPSSRQAQGFAEAVL